VKFRAIAPAIIAIACSTAAVSTLQKAAAPATTSSAPKPYTGPLPALPVAEFALPRPDTVVRAVYEFAARRPDVLHYVPCFCGCEQGGHVGNDDCFVKARNAAGKPTAWEPHGMG
jgi:hypothetical protein